MALLLLIAGEVSAKRIEQRSKLPVRYLCAELGKLVPELSACAPTAFGAVIGRKKHDVDKALAKALEGEQSFRKYFGRATPHYVIALGGSPEAHSRLYRSNLTLLTWQDSEFFERSIIGARSAAIDEWARKEVRSQTAGQNLSAAEIEDKVLAAKSTIGGSEDAASGFSDPIPHELGHHWFIDSFWPGRRGESHYGGPAPDWLDEVAAVLHEDAAQTANRRKQFADAYFEATTSGTPPSASATKLLNLTAFLSTEHPTSLRLRAAERTVNKDDKGALVPGVTVQVEIRSGTSLGDDEIFYLQSRIFADFMIERTANSRIFAVIASAIARGMTLDQWLRKEGARHRVGGSIVALEAQWHDWLKSRFDGRERSVGKRTSILRDRSECSTA